MDPRAELVMIVERIRNARKRLKLSQTALGQRIGYSMNGIAKIERGESDPKFSSLVKLAGALETDLAYLVTGDRQYGQDLRKTLEDLMTRLPKSVDELPDDPPEDPNGRAG